ncbi:Structure-specific endonuclease subunit SLX1 [Fusarium agapanthi]|uniref:Structure-specific endonuclease subunit SLX1 n=1 Tax=Fusarium agapanthi TaxID=1803897 RepID=A0A9P5B548_9HYPO|nr:Structure-specific endonuclease subunit SLX1 [Fusarium agapanthi]
MGGYDTHNRVPKFDCCPEIRVGLDEPSFNDTYLNRGTHNNKGAQEKGTTEVPEAYSQSEICEPKKAWDNWLKVKETTPREGIKITEDYEPDEGSNGTKSVEPWGIHALPLDYAPIKPYVEKAHNVVKFEREGNCVHCHEALESGKGFQPMCPHDGCEAMGHLDCWSKHALKGEPKEMLLPLSCTCPSCGGKINWSDMMKELTLRVRGPKEVAKLLKKKRRTKKEIAAEAEAEEDI